jgi:hypothetical protein
MAKQNDPGRFKSQLLQQDEPLNESKYQEYRESLEKAFRTAERRLVLTGWFVVLSGVISLTLLFVGGSKLIGDFDPWSKNANISSVAAGVVFVLATVLFWVSLASYYSRFRPGLKDTKERLRDASILELQRQIRELRDLVERSLRHDE